MPECQLLDIRCPMADFRFQTAGQLGQRRRIRIKVHIDKPAELGDLYLIKADILGFEILQMLGMRCADQLAIKLINPRMIGAHDAAGLPLAFKQVMRPVLADIVECPQNPFPVAHHGDRAACDVDGRVLPRFAQLFHVAHPLPCPGDDFVPINLEPFGLHIGIGPKRAGVVRIAAITVRDRFELGFAWLFGHGNRSVYRTFQGQMNRVSLTFQWV